MAASEEPYRTRNRLTSVAPGLGTLLHYRFREYFRHDLTAGISVAAVAIPVAVAYAQLAGFNPVYGLYSSILPLIAYAIFGTSRQLIVNPDAATCALVAAAVAPLAGSDSDLYLSLSVTLTFLSGLLCIAASFLRLGALADFLSRPILVGFLNGIAISIFVGQLGKVLGISVRGNGIVSQLLGTLESLPNAHLLTVGVSFASLALLFLSIHFLPRVPGALIVLAVAAAVVALLKLEQRGVAVLGPIPAGLPPFRLPRIPLADLPSLIGEASGLALVLFSSGALTARSFATKNRYALDIDREFAAFGAANIASALSQGFAVTGADSRTAMADAAGGRTQMTGIAAAVTMSLVLMFFTEPLQYVPNAALGAVLIFAAFSLFDLRSIRELWNIDRLDMSLAVVTMLAVLAVGAIHGILVAVALALCRFVHKTARPRDEVLGTVDGLPGFHSIDRHPTAKTPPGLALFRFNAPLTFFNADYFKQRALRAANQAGTHLQWFVIDAIPISDIDTDGLYALRDLNHTLAQRGVTLIIAGRRTEFLDWLRQIGIYRPDHGTIVFPTLRQAVKAFQSNIRPSSQADGFSNSGRPE